VLVQRDAATETLFHGQENAFQTPLTKPACKFLHLDRLFYAAEFSLNSEDCYEHFSAKHTGDDGYGFSMCRQRAPTISGMHQRDHQQFQRHSDR
jgi:hypothetical protein